ncbi:defensin Tk-AMP-D1.1 [Lathyrus oleraceus]|uniref:defensin Tk-AMP-D1.1 n=1 Tax=Pisum sativum TaxID=3888 RepID=UPI0021D0E88E|nr:defensin Tk-AMP-D1.1-like [Pisum sativum]
MNKTHFEFFFIFLILLASEMVIQIEGTRCELKSYQFQGICFSDRSCAKVCNVEGYIAGGKCRGFFSHCYCKKSC